MKGKQFIKLTGEPGAFTAKGDAPWLLQFVMGIIKLVIITNVE